MADTAPETLRKSYAADVTVEPGERAIVCKVSTSAVDREGDVLLPSGMDASQFMDNPCVFYAHDYTKPIARTEKLWRDDYAVYAKDVFPARPEGHDGDWLPDTVFALIQAGVIRGVSVGFQIKEARFPSKKDIEMFGQDVKRVHSKWLKLEHSIAPLPMNQSALITAVSKGMVTKAAAGALLGVDVDALPKPAEEAPAEPETKAAPEPERPAPAAQVRVIAPRRKLYVIVPAAVPTPAPKPPDVAGLAKRYVAKAAGRLYAD